ncbi:MAG: tyrosine-type recombinase/integrase [Candidatus Nanopelagicales bacterium]|nr:tyrosine-type recombinase/integrase [Candidatus Nanopelagicales bacterium]
MSDKANKHGVSVYLRPPSYEAFGRLCRTEHQKPKFMILAGLAAVQLLDCQEKNALYSLIFRHVAKMFRADLAAAGIPEVDSAGRVLDTYSLRHTAISRLARTGAPFSVVQALARHLTPTTTARYVHTRLADTRAAIESLPTPAAKAPRKPTRRRRTAGRRSA